MPIKILMPALSPTMTEGNLVKWNKKEGDQVKSGDVIAEIETDKATMEVESADEGILGRILIQEGTKAVKVNAVIGLILEEGENKSELDKVIIDAPEEQKVENKEEKIDTQQKSQTITSPVASAPVMQASKRVFASPLAKRLAKEKGFDITQIKGTGPNGRVVKNDVLSFIGGKGGFISRAMPEQSVFSISTMREVIAKRLLESKQHIPHFYLSMDFNLDKLLEMRADINSAVSAESVELRISVNDLVTKAVSMSLKKHPSVNSSWNKNSIIQYNNVDISIAVAIPDGLITPIVRNADQKSIFEISKEIKSLVIKAKESSLKPEEFQGGGITISNLGMYGINSFSAIINPPQSSILAVGAGIEKAVVKNGQVVSSTVMNITMACDHRVVDGAVAAAFLNSLKDYIEKPSRLLI
ncbi:MAG: pyruvate dehydrogenase complex dihydrolipoamide acetyltransferase [Rickettsiales bacterium]|nr:pyruvate dehydrogenase complex dihydrolipoamide acetyltransferase [Rickettsiales bacterium]